MKNKYKKLFVTGGHITPALAVIDEIKKTHPDWSITLAGRNNLEERLAREKHIGYTGYKEAMFSCIREKPDCIVSFGSYVAVPVCVAAWFLHIPIITHEQTRITGRANRWIAKIAKKICVTFDDTVQEFPKEKTTVTGLPLRSQLFHPPKQSPFTITKDRPLIYITGGSTGAESLNTILFPIIPILLQRFIVVHQTGIPSLAKAKEIQSEQYIARDFFDVEALSWIYHHANLVIARSGANTVMELAVLEKKAILVPLPWSAGGEQRANAQWFSQLGLGHVIEQSDLKANQLLERIDALIAAPELRTATGIARDGASRLVGEIDAIL